MKRRRARADIVLTPRIAARSGRGAREHNEDDLRFGVSEDAAYAVLSDGAGGHDHGAVASDLVVRLLTQRLQAAPQVSAEALHDAVHEAHDMLVQQQQGGVSPQQHMHATLVALWIDLPRGLALWSHVGDSRLYLLRGGCVFHVTRDDSVVQQMLDAGLITQEQAAKHPERNRIYNCLGGPQLPLVWLANPVPVSVGDTIMLSSDGFWAHLPEEELGGAIAKQSIVDCLPSLMQVAEKRGGKKADNLTVVAMTWENESATEADNGKKIITDGMAHNIFTTEMGASLNDKQSQYDDVTEDEIDKAIAEIQSTIKKFSR